MYENEIKMYGNVRKCIEVYENVLKEYKNKIKCITMYENVWKCMKMYKIVRICNKKCVYKFKEMKGNKLKVWKCIRNV